MDVKKFVDVSSCFLFEATGDSETGVLDPGMLDASHSNEDDGDGGGDDDDDDDAGSCVCDASEIPMVSKIYEVDYDLQLQVTDDEEEENGEVVEQDVQGWNKDQQIGLQTKQTSTVSGDSKKTMSEREKSKLFWETCLAS